MLNFIIGVVVFFVPMLTVYATTTAYSGGLVAMLVVACLAVNVILAVVLCFTEDRQAPAILLIMAGLAICIATAPTMGV